MGHVEMLEVMLAIRIFECSCAIDKKSLAFLLETDTLVELSVEGETADSKRRTKPLSANPLPQHLSEANWQSVATLSMLVKGTFSDLPEHVPHFRSWLAEDAPESVAMPMPWNEYSRFEQLLIVKAMRPDRLKKALNLFVCHVFGSVDMSKLAPVSMEQTLDLAVPMHAADLSPFPSKIQLVLLTFAPVSSATVDAELEAISKA